MHNKKKTTTKAALFLFLLLLCTSCMIGCGEKYPEKASDGSTWDKEWTILGTTLGIEATDNGFSILENPVVLTGDDLHYATWSTGEPQKYTNAEGKETDLYDAEIYALVSGVSDKDVAEKTVAEWIAAENETYNVLSTEEITCNGQSYTLLTYTVESEDNPNDRGATAFTVYGNYCVTVELTCLDSYTGDATSILTDFLNHCHYNAAQQ